MAKEKVYCSECVFMGGKNTIQCKHPDNQKEVDDWFGKRAENKSFANEINRKNNCKWFKAKSDVRVDLVEFENGQQRSEPIPM